MMSLGVCRARALLRRFRPSRATHQQTRKACWTMAVGFSEEKRRSLAQGVLSGFSALGFGRHGESGWSADDWQDRQTNGGAAALRQEACRGRNHRSGGEERRTRFANKNLRRRLLPCRAFRVSSGRFMARCWATSLTASPVVRRRPRSSRVASRRTRVP